MASAYLRRDPLNVAWPGLSGALRERARMGAGPDHRVLVDVRLRPSGGRERTGAAGASGGVLRGVARLPVGLVPGRGMSRRD